MKKQSPKIINAKLASIWSKEKLRNIAPLRGGFAFKSEKFQNTGIPIVRISNIKFDGTVGGEFEYYSKIIPDEKFVLRGRSILLAMSGATTGKIAMLDSEEEYYQNQRVGYFQNTGEVDYEFISSVLQTKAFTNQLNAVLVAGAQPNISSKEIDSFEFCIPDSIDEQSAIGSLFRTLDDLLASYKDNLANYQSLKVTMLSKMFPKTGQIVPEIRLDGFEGKWETKMLSEVTNITMGQSPKSENYTDNPNDHILVQGNADIKDKQVVPRLWTTEVTKMAEIGDIILTVRAPVGDIGKTDYNVVIGRGVAAIKGNDFIFYTLEKMKKTGFWNRFSTGSTFESISSNDIKEAIIQIPTLKEQQAIGYYFSNLDNLINSHQEKISQLETLKKKLLQDMFI